MVTVSGLCVGGVGLAADSMTIVYGNRVSVRLIPASESDDEEVFGLGRRLRAELEQLDVLAVESTPAGAAPATAKGAADIAGWVDLILGGAEQLATVVALVLNWSARNRQTVEVSIDGDPIKLGAATPDQQERLVAAWLARHAPDA